MALPLRPDSKRIGKTRPKSCEVVSQKSEWKRSFENRKSVFEQSCSPLLDKKFASSIVLDKQSKMTTLGSKEVRLYINYLLKMQKEHFDIS